MPKSRIFYITYDGLLDNVSRSQVVPYLTDLGRKGYDITILSFEKIDKLKLSSKLDLIKEDFKNNNISWIYKKYHRSPTVPATIYDIVIGVLTGLSINRKQKIGIIHCRGYIPELMGAILKFFIRSKLIFDMRGFWPEEKVDGGVWKKDGMIYSVFKFFEKRFFIYSDRIIVLTEAAKKTIQEKFALLTDITVIPCCVDTVKFSDPGPSYSPSADLPDLKKRFVVLYAGSLGTFYNLKELLSFFTVIKKIDPSSYLLIASDYPSESVLKEAQKFNISPDDLMVKNLDYCEMPMVYSLSSVSLIFYTRRLSLSGCCPIKLGESLASGVPVIANTGIGDCDRIITDEKVGVILNDFSVDEYRKAFMGLKELMIDRDGLKARCRAFAFRYLSLGGGVDKYLEVYNNLLKK